MSQSKKPTTANASTAHTRIRSRRTQNFLLVWLYSSTNIINNKDHIDTINKLREVVNTIHTFTSLDECIDFISDIQEEETFIIASGALGKTVIPVLDDMEQVSAIYIYSGNKIHHEQWAQQWSKIKGVFTDIVPICKALKQATQECDQNTISMSFVTLSGDQTNKNLDQLDQSFMYTQILKEILLTINFEQRHIQEFITYCREQFDANPAELKTVDKLEREYHKYVPIWWYTSPCFLYSMVNHALRSMEINLIISMGFFIRDLCKHIAQLHSKQYAEHTHPNSFMVYRGQGLSQTDFDKLVKTKGGLLSFNNFLSTSLDRTVSLAFAESILSNLDLISVLFEITINPLIPSTSFANARDVSCFQEEEEILFSMHSIFRIGNIQQMGKNRLWQVELVLTSDNDPQLHTLTEHIREETFPHAKGWYRLGNLLIKIGQFDKAQQVCEIMLEQKPDDREEATIYHMRGIIKTNQEEYAQAITYYEQSIEIEQKILSPTYSNLAASYNGIGVVYHKMGEYSKALSYYEKDLEFLQKILPPNHPSLAISYNNIGRVYDHMGEYSKALSYYAKALEILQKTLPPNHPDFAQSCSNSGLVYDNMGEYSKALSYFEKALEIRQKVLPPNHPSLATSYNNIGMVYNHMGEYSKALSYYEKNLEIDQKILPPNHTSLATSYNNIGMVYDDIGEYSKALSYYEKTLVIYQKTLPQNHPSLATSYNNIGSVYNGMGDYSKALSYHEKALEMRQKTLPPNHPDSAASYNNIGSVYYNMAEHSKALSYYEKALEISQKTLPPNHPDLAASYNNIGLVYNKIGEYSKALSYYEKALEIRQKVLPPNHPDLAASYNNIGLVYGNMGEYSKVLPYYEKALEISQKTLPPNHPDLAASYNNIGLVYNKIGEYSKALSYHEKALEIKEKTLPQNHPSLATSYNNIGSVYNGMGDYSKALSYHEKALEIKEKTLPQNHPSLATSYDNIGSVYNGMGDYSKALSFFERALEIGQRSLPANHPDLEMYKKWIEIVKEKL